ncbi:MAG TPA: hypothetical protein VNS49_04605 [Streptomyces sp.]|nr:hypothetical protein [Streptomyces sp.]
MAESEEQVAAATGCGCLVTFVAAATGFWVWFDGARPGVIGAFEGRRDWSLIYIELPCMFFGFPLITLLAWAWMRAVLRARTGRAMRNAVSGVVVVLMLVVAGVASHAWLTHRVDSIEWLNQEE